MATYLIKSNPKKHPWADLDRAVAEVRRKGFFETGWSCGNTKRIKRGDRVFLLRTGVEPRAIMASGVVTEEPYEAAHYDRERGEDSARYVGVRFDALLHPDHEAVLRIVDLRTTHLAQFSWHTQSSGITIPPAVAAELETAWSEFLMSHGQKPISLPDEVATPARFFEGAVRQIFVNTYERSPYARQQCIQHHGCCCSVCGFDFEHVFGELGRGFIHVHHLIPLADIQEEYEIDPITDLRPICPNCHAMIHRGPEMLSIEALKRCIQMAQPDGPANGSQPIRSETNSTSSAAGSRR